MLYRTKTILLFILLISVSVNGWSKVNVSKTEKFIMPLDISEPLISADTTEKLQPKSLGVGESGGSVFSKIADNSLALLWDRSNIKNTTVGRAAEKIEKNLKTEMQFIDKTTQQTNHRIAFKILAMQALAKLEYKGWINAAINYDARAAKAEAEVTESLFKKQDIILSHAITREENKSQLALRWNW